MTRKNSILPRLLMVSALALIITTLLSANNTSAAIVWQDNFNDGDYDGWTIEGLGDFGITSNALIATGSAGVWNFIRYPSTVAFGWWSFDVLSEDAPGNHSYVYIISGVAEIPNYRLAIWTGSYSTWASGPGVSVIKTNTTDNFSIAEWFPGTAFSGWHSYNVTRDNTGLFNIYIDGTLRLTFTDNEITTSSYFRFGAQENSGIDNVVVNDSPPSTPSTTPPPIPGFPMVAILTAIPLALGFASLMRRRK